MKSIHHRFIGMTFDNDMSGSSQGADVSENDRVRAVPDRLASSSFIVNFVFIAVMIVAMLGFSPISFRFTGLPLPSRIKSFFVG
jgi:hypothetical protein